MHITKNIIALGSYTACIGFLAYGAFEMNYLSMGIGVAFLAIAEKIKED